MFFSFVMTNFGFVVLPPDLNNSSPCPESWLAAKRKADSCDGETFSCSEDSSTWRLHDDLYDLTSFVEKHPGGRDWILMTRGTDITGDLHICWIVCRNYCFNEIV